MRRFFQTVLLAAAALAAGCRSEYHAYDTRIEGARDIHARNIPRIETACSGKRTIRFAVISDTQRWYDETAAAIAALNAREDLDFVIHAGDMSDFGLRAEFERQRDLLERLRVPYVALIGNHDGLGTGRRVFEKIFGAPDFAFTAGTVRFVCVDTNALDADYVGIPNFAFVEQELAGYPAECDRTLCAMHASPASEQLNGEPGARLHALFRRFPGLQICVHGHGHAYEVRDLFEDGVYYIQTDAMSERNYLLYTLTEEGWSHEQIYF